MKIPAWLQTDWQALRKGSYNCGLFIAAFAVGAMVGAAETKKRADFADEDLATAKIIISEFVHERKAFPTLVADDRLLAQAQELLKTIKDLEDYRQNLEDQRKSSRLDRDY